MTHAKITIVAHTTKKQSEIEHIVNHLHGFENPKIKYEPIPVKQERDIGKPTTSLMFRKDAAQVLVNYINGKEFGGKVATAFFRVRKLADGEKIYFTIKHGHHDYSASQQMVAIVRNFFPNAHMTSGGWEQCTVAEYY